MPGIVNPIALSSAASVFACSGVSSTSGGRTVRPRRIVRVDRNRLFQRSDHRRILSATEHLTHDI